MSDLVPNRECGACAACCEALLIDDPQLTKLPAVLCPHYRDGCSVYETRPSTCRVWFCGWRRLQHLNEDWRPDKCGIMIVPTSLAYPVRLEDGLEFVLLDGLEKIFWAPFIEVVSILIRAGFPVYLVVPHEKGFQSIKCHLNPDAGLKAAIERNDIAAITASLLAAAQACMAAPNVKVEFKNQPETGMPP